MSRPSSRPVAVGPRVLALVALAALAAALAGCGERKDKPSSPTAARVNKDEISLQQVNQLVQQQRGLRPEQTEPAARQALERLIDQQLVLQKAEEIKLDRDPRVAQLVEAARRDVLARAYVDRLGEGAAKPTPEEVQKYFDDKPALFAQRRIYNLQELAIEARPEQVAALRERLAAARNINEFVEYLKASEFRFAASQAVRAAEQLPLASLDAVARMQDGQASISATPSGAQVVVLAGSRSQPVTLEQARPAIEQFLLNERRRKLAEDELKALRAAAKIEYLDKFAPPAGAAAAPASAASAR